MSIVNNLLLTDVKTVGNEDLVLVGARTKEDIYTFYLHLKHSFISKPMSDSDMISLRQQLNNINIFARYIPESNYPEYKFGDKKILEVKADRFVKDYLPKGKFQPVNFSEYAKWKLGFPFALMEFDEFLLHSIASQNKYRNLFDNIDDKLMCIKIETKGRKRRKDLLNNLIKKYQFENWEATRTEALRKFCEDLKIFGYLEGQLSDWTPEFENKLNILLDRRDVSDSSRKESVAQIKDLITVDLKNLPGCVTELANAKLEIGNDVTDGYAKANFENKTIDVYLNSKKGIRFLRRAGSEELSEFPGVIWDIEVEQFKKNPRITPISANFTKALEKERKLYTIRDCGSDNRMGTKICLFPPSEELIKHFADDFVTHKTYSSIGQNIKGFDLRVAAKTGCFNVGDDGSSPSRMGGFSANMEVFGKEQLDFSPFFKNFSVLSNSKLEVICGWAGIDFNKIINYVEEDLLERKAIKGDKNAAAVIADYAIGDVKESLEKLIDFKHKGIDFSKYMYQLGLVYENHVGLALNNKSQNALPRQYYKKFKSYKFTDPDFKKEIIDDALNSFLEVGGLKKNKKLGLIVGGFFYLPILQESECIRDFLLRFPSDVDCFYSYLKDDGDPLIGWEKNKRYDMHYHALLPFCEEIVHDINLVKKGRMSRNEFLMFYELEPNEFLSDIKQSAKNLASKVKHANIINDSGSLCFYEGEASFDKPVVSFDAKMISGKSFVVALVGNTITSYGIKVYKSSPQYEKGVILAVVDKILKENDLEGCVKYLHNCYQEISCNTVDKELLCYNVELKDHLSNYDKKSKNYNAAIKLGLREIGDEAWYAITKDGMKKYDQVEQSDIDTDYYLVSLFGKSTDAGTLKFDGVIGRLLTPVFWLYSPARKQMMNEAIKEGKINNKLFDLDYDDFNKTKNEKARQLSLFQN